MLCQSCTKPDTVVLSNLEVGYKDVVEDELTYDLKLKNAVTQGIRFPEDEGDYIRFSFDLNGFYSDSVAYKMFYRNISYLEPVAVERQFYGGWGYGAEGFHFADVGENARGTRITDSLRIVGNPRNESKYFGIKRVNPTPTQEDIDKVVYSINNTPEWSAAILQKASERNIPYDDQVLKDAIWVIANRPEEGDVNNRWKRNPRMGEYEFLLVVMDLKRHHELDESYTDISLPNDSGLFVNPFISLVGMDGITTQRSTFKLKLRSSFDPGNGVFVNRLSAESTEWDTSSLTDLCNSSDELFEEAHWEQFFHAVNRSYYLKNIPISKDVVNGYTREEYQRNVEKYPIGERDSTHFDISEIPCQTISVEGDSAIVMRNHAGRKEPVGVTSRIGMSFGTYTLKVEFSDMLSDDNVWNGITNAFWLIYDSNKDWNKRSFSKTGYLKKEQKLGEPEVRLDEYIYSEIDIEIVKAAEHWPIHSYKGEVPAFDDPASNNDVIVSFTNWDMANRDPEHFIMGAEYHETPEGNYWYHRWHEMYNAITCKQGYDHDEIFERPYYYFQIEWAPDHITWRKGPEKDELEVFGYMDDSITKIPDNQMRAVITQEFHASEWWPTEPFTQDNIPYPLNDLEGRVLELTIE